ncbi:NAD(P)H-binding protein [Mycobacterium sp. 852002-51961_SCH5331710]|uniref:SDR family oxidoreductase n=1 Tax=Mycobacterium sp. 852002-51961_SCH5331710 TaxID=1834105 RepID=UPI0007FD91DE|nr:NAD(P)H-binding protein [Mycobacterium sp. 852002-51961_SCH5331710]OBB35054.1 LysR family transcriptional regulator [Mycobacterium sp. 852002-51961_SCH5331710]
MKITVIGSTGLIGSNLVSLLGGEGHSVVGAARSTGVDVLSGDGVADAIAGADVVIDVTNSPSFEDGPVMDFFTTSTTNLVTAAKAAGVGHYVALSIVGADDLPESGYLRAKVAQETIIRDSGLPYSIVRATQFHEFAEAITDSLNVDGEVRAPDALIQPIAAQEVAAEVAEVAVGKPRNGHIDVGGPDKIPFADLARAVLAKRGDDRRVVVTREATYFGTPLAEGSLVTGDDAVIAATRFTDWLARR